MNLYHKYRPTSLDQIRGNATTVQALKGHLLNGGLPHVLLFYGPIGCGKTTISRILKEELDCHDFDYVEINASMDRGIDKIREVIRKIHLAPVAGPCRIWMFDESHGLLGASQEALLKSTEDFPNHSYFFFCTTEINKIIPALRSRCHPFPIQSLCVEELEDLVDFVCQKEEIKLSSPVKTELLFSANGSARNALVLLEKIAHLNEEQRLKSLQEKEEAEQQSIELCRALLKKQSWKTVSGILRNLKEEPETIRRSILGYAKKVLLDNKSGADSQQAWRIIASFRKNFYDGGDAELCASCFEVICDS